MLPREASNYSVKNLAFSRAAIFLQSFWRHRCGTLGTCIQDGPRRGETKGRGHADGRTITVAIQAAVALDAAAWSRAATRFAEMDGEATAWLAGEGVPPEQRDARRAVDLRYEGQNFEVRVPLADPATPLDQVLADFAAEHERTYGYAIPGRTIETWVRIDRPGTFYGQCNQICGEDHSNMPIAVRALPEAEFTAWLAEAKKKFAANETAPTREVAAPAPAQGSVPQGSPNGGAVLAAVRQ